MDSTTKLAASPSGISVEVANVHLEDVDICLGGDLSLEVHIQPGILPLRYRVQSQVLMQDSAYFRILLGSDRFQEGLAFRDGLKKLQKNYDKPSAYPRSELPKIKINELGHISASPRKQQDIFGQLLRLLHDQKYFDDQISLGRLANIAIVADRFDCLSPVRSWARQHDVFDRNFISGNALPSSSYNERRRRLILVGWLLRYPAWISSYSTNLILMPRESTAASNPQSLSWMDLPGHIEEEIRDRHRLVLETIDSLLQHFIQLYMPVDRRYRVLQCRMGYETSRECDTFQLGQMLQFFCRMGMGFFQTLKQHEVQPVEARDVSDTIRLLRECPSYQLDRHHSHCGIRDELRQRIEVIEGMFAAGTSICGKCWLKDWTTQQWSMGRQGKIWKYNERRGKGSKSHSNPHQCPSRQEEARVLFTAEERDWSG